MVNEKFYLLLYLNNISTYILYWNVKIMVISFMPWYKYDVQIYQYH